MHPSGVAKSSTNFGWGKGSNVTYAGWQVTLCDPIWHVRSSSGVATSVSELLYPCYFIFTVFDGDLNPLRGVRAPRRWERATPGGRVGRRTAPSTGAHAPRSLPDGQRAAEQSTDCISVSRSARRSSPCPPVVERWNARTACLVASVGCPCDAFLDPQP